MQFTEHDNSIKITVPVSLSSLSAELIQQQLQQNGFGRCFLLTDQITNLLVEYQQLQLKIKEKVLQENAKELNYRVAEKRPAEIHFDISEDQMAAFAIITSAWGGPPISANMLVKAAQQAGIVFGFSKEQIIRLVSHAAKAEPGSKTKLMIARGRELKQGDNSHFEALLPEMESRRNRPRVDSEEKADLRDFGVIPSINAGEALMRRHAPTAGIDGMTVTGTLMPATPGLTIAWQPGEGTDVSANDPDLLLATRDGLPRVIEAGATVDEVFNVKNVDLTSGHIMFRGSVIISGDVTEGMKVIAGGNVFVKGIMEGSLIEAGGDITITGSVIGHQVAQVEENTQYSTELKAVGDIQCNTAQYTKLSCGGNLYVNKQLLHCSVEACRVFAGPEDKPNGKLVGGYYYLDEGIICGQLGSPSSSAVKVSLNRILDPIVAKQDVLRLSIQAEKQQMDEIKLKIEQLKKIHATAPSANTEMQLLQLGAEFDEHRELAMALMADIKELEQQRQEKLSGLLIQVKEQLFSAVEMQFGKESTRSRREYGPSKVLVVDGRPAIEPL
ncbi:DUF342 domain-containing protein [Arsukibacterium sp.]|uniref:DUF342 domain-containing protein n=1 Tax=Arsukibacterium sp. TaxID=1977258 RepID=UPI002FDB0415